MPYIIATVEGLLTIFALTLAILRVWELFVVFYSGTNSTASSNIMQTVFEFVLCVTIAGLMVSNFLGTK
jgi:hypothetical protein